MKEPVWLRKDVLLAVHEWLLAEHGGSSGVRDDGLFESALDRPKNLLAYEKPTIYDLASAYACRIIKNHPFVDGNKRTGFMAAFLFLGRNGVEFNAVESDVVLKTLAFAAGGMIDKEYAAWLREHPQGGRLTHPISKAAHERCEFYYSNFLSEKSRSSVHRSALEVL